MIGFHGHRVTRLCDVKHWEEDAATNYINVEMYIGGNLLYLILKY